MPVQILIPSALRARVDRPASVSVAAPDVMGAPPALTDAYPDPVRHRWGASGQLRTFVNVYLGEDDVRRLPLGDRTALRGGEVLAIAPSIAGGAR